MSTAQEETLIEQGTQTVCFSIDGEFLTDFCRNLVTDGRWRHALRTLTEGIRDFGYENALAILRGDKKLVGVNDVELVDEDRADKRDAYLELLAWQYAGMWRRPDGMWQPYAEVTSFGRQDVPCGVAMREAGSFNLSRKFSNARVLYYADAASDRVFDEYEDATKRLSSVLWRRVEDPPLWLNGCDTAASAMADLELRGRWLEERGAHLSDFSSSRDDLNDDDDTDEPIDDRWAAATKELEDFEHARQSTSALEELAVSQFGSKGAEMIAAIMGTQQDDDEAPQPDKECASEGGYILPNGLFYGCPYMGHPQLAGRLLRHVVGLRDFDGDTEKEADRRNWLRIQPSALQAGKFSIMSPKGRPTKAQEKTLADWCIAHQQTYPSNL